MLKKIIISVLVLGYMQGYCQEPNVARKAKKAAKADITLENDTTDPICKMSVAKGSKNVSIYKDKQVGFCSKSCKEQFDKNPEKYIK